MLKWKWISLFFILSINSLLLSACMYSTAITGAQALYDRHNLQKKFDDNMIAIKAYQAIYMASNNYQETNVSVAAFNGSVILTGQTGSLRKKHEIAQLVKKIAGDRKIYDFTTASMPTASLIRVSDAWITAKIKAQLIADNDADPTQIKVITENGTVYLVGVVPPEQAKLAVDVARTTAGVQSVVKVFSYLRISSV